MKIFLPHLGQNVLCWLRKVCINSIDIYGWKTQHSGWMVHGSTGKWVNLEGNYDIILKRKDRWYICLNCFKEDWKLILFLFSLCFFAVFLLCLFLLLHSTFNKNYLKKWMSLLPILMARLYIFRNHKGFDRIEIQRF